MIYLITGGAGFIGSNFIKYHHEQHPLDRLICIDKLTYAGCMSNLDYVLSESNFRFVKGDICKRDQVFALFEEEHPDIVVNFAAESHVDRSIKEPDIFIQTNVVGTGILLDACREYGIQRFHQVSTDEVYGDLPLNSTTSRFTEESPLRGNSPYSASKAAADLLVQSYHRTYGLPVTISRCSNNYGPCQDSEKLIPMVIHRVFLNETVPIYGNGLNIRDWLFVKDHCQALEMILKDGQDGEVYNIAGHQEMKNLELVKYLLKKLGKPEDLITFVSDRPGHDLRYVLDDCKIRRELGWKPQMTFEQGMSETIQWYFGGRVFK